MHPSLLHHISTAETVVELRSQMGCVFQPTSTYHVGLCHWYANIPSSQEGQSLFIPLFVAQQARLLD